MATDDNPYPGRSSRYLQYLPAVYQQDAEDGRESFLGRFLLALEKILTGLGDVHKPGLEEILEGIATDDGRVVLAGVHRYFEPGPELSESEHTPAEFLEWLAGWVALSLRADLDEQRRREFIARAVSLYRLRGTKGGLREFVRIYTRLAPDINELNTPFQIGVSSTIGKDTVLDGGAPHFFRVLIRLPEINLEQLRRQRDVATAIIDMEKPAHTFYELDVETPTLQIGVHSTIGVDTLLGASPS